MKKIICACILATLITIIALPLNVYAAVPGTIAVKGTPQFGNEIDSKWNDVDAVSIDKVKAGESTGTSGSFKLMWDSDKIYVLVTVKDSTDKHAESISTGDSLEIYISSQNKKGLAYGEGDYGFAITSNGVFHAGDDNPINPSQVTSKSIKTDDGYIIQFSVDIGALEEYRKIGLEIQINDTTTGEYRDVALGWSDELDNAWFRTEALGTVTLVNDKNSEVPTEAPEETATASSETPTSTTSTKPAASGNDNDPVSPVIIIAVVSVVVVAAAGAFIILRKNKK